MNQEGTPTDLALAGIEAAEKRHTPSIEQLRVHFHHQLQYGRGPVNCDGKLEVLDVAPAFSNYSHVFVGCKKCQTVTALPNPMQTVAATDRQAAPDFKKRAGGDR